MSEPVVIRTEIEMTEDTYRDAEMRYMIRVVNLFEEASACDDLSSGGFARIIGFVADRYGDGRYA